MGLLLEAVRHLCMVDKNRLVDSVMRTFFLTYPNSTYLRPYEPHRSSVHLRLQNSGTVCSTNTAGNEEDDDGEGEQEKVKLTTASVGKRLQKTKSDTLIHCTSYVEEYVALRCPF